MKVLILNGSPHKNGDTEYIINKIKAQLPSNTEFVTMNAYEENIKPCIDCRYCWKDEGCSIKDGMEKVVRDDYDVIVLASPIYMSYITPPLFSIVTRLNYIWSNQFFLKKQAKTKRKKGLLVLVGGGAEGTEDNAINISNIAFKFLNADFDIEKNYVFSLNTNTIPAKEDKTIDEQINNVINNILN